MGAAGVVDARGLDFSHFLQAMAEDGLMHLHAAQDHSGVVTYGMGGSVEPHTCNIAVFPSIHNRN